MNRQATASSPLHLLVAGMALVTALRDARANANADGTFGATLVGPSTPAPETTGYYASYAGGVVVKSREHGGTQEDLKAAAALIFQMKEGEYIGIWGDTDDTVYVDITRWFATEDEALAFAAENNQKAIYDIANKSSIYLSQLATTAN